MATRETLARCWLMLRQANPICELTEAEESDMARFYARLLADLPDEVLEAAVLHVIASVKLYGRALHQVAEIREAANTLIAAAEGTPKAHEAWGEVMAAIRRVGAYRVPEFSNPLIDRCVYAIGGWVYLCTSDDTLMSDRAQFIKAYEGFLAMDAEERRMLPPVRKLLNSFDEHRNREHPKQLERAGGLTLKVTKKQGVE